MAFVLFVVSLHARGEHGSRLVSTVEVTTFASIWTIVVLAVFVAIVIWVVTRRKGYFDKAARLPFEDREGRGGETGKEEDHG